MPRLECELAHCHIAPMAIIVLFACPFGLVNIHERMSVSVCVCFELCETALSPCALRPYEDAPRAHLPQSALSRAANFRAVNRRQPMYRAMNGGQVS